jgi:hypothetical protein
MGTRQIFLLVLFGAHWLAFVALLWRRRTPSLLLPLGVFTLLILTQLFWANPAHVPLGPLGEPLLPQVLRASAVLLALASVGLMSRRLYGRRSARLRGEP